MKKFAKIAAALAVVAISAMPAFAQRGSADFTTFVAIGDSYGAGYANNSLNERHQVFSWPAIIAKQVGLRLCVPGDAAAANCFAQPLVSYPGIGPEMVLTSLAPTIVTLPGSGAPLMPTFGRAYNNLSIPGATVRDVNTIRGNEANPTRGPERLAQFILRGLGTEVDQALSLHPTFIAVWIGGNDFLGAATSGTPALLTSVDDFRTQYNAMLDRLVAGAPNAGMVVGNLPTTPNVPYLTTVPRVVVDLQRRPVLDPTGQPIPLIYDAGNGNIQPVPAGSFVLLHAQTKLQSGIGFPAFLRTVPPFSQLPNVGTPLADTDVLTPTELSAITARVTEFNTIIQQAASARSIPVADIRGLFDRVAGGHLTIGPFAINPSYILGGFFSLDGVHPTDLGYILFANEFIRAINDAYDTEIPVASITQLFANNGAFFGSDSHDLRANATLSEEAASSLRSWWAGNNPAVSTQRFRAMRR
ncbi:MAG TPA: SGNH/GDSL hydrolase family protein [Thermoanaerobaculia bacterium]